MNPINERVGQDTGNPARSHHDPIFLPSLRAILAFLVAPFYF